jgi:hypothetical protein
MKIKPIEIKNKSICLLAEKHPIEIVHVTQSESGDSKSGFTFAMTILYREI